MGIICSCVYLCCYTVIAVVCFSRCAAVLVVGIARSEVIAMGDVMRAVGLAMPAAWLGSLSLCWGCNWERHPWHCSPGVLSRAYWAGVRLSGHVALNRRLLSECGASNEEPNWHVHTHTHTHTQRLPDIHVHKLFSAVFLQTKPGRIHTWVWNMLARGPVEYITMWLINVPPCM